MLCLFCYFGVRSITALGVVWELGLHGVGCGIGISGSTLLILTDTIQKKMGKLYSALVNSLAE